MKLVLLDRDGVINRDLPYGVLEPAEFEMLPGAAAAIARLTRAGFRIAICTNQSAIGKGLTTHANVHVIHGMLRDAVELEGGRIHAIYYAPEAPEEPSKRRKPAPGMLLDALRDFNATAIKTPFVGDMDRDLEAALRKALECDEPRRAAEWTELVAHGATDPDLRAKIVAAFGTGDVICGHAETGPCTGVTWSARGGARPAFWLGWHRGHDAGPAPNPTIQGPALVARVRRLLAIPTPRDVAVVARGQKALRRQVRAEGCKAAAALEATP